MEIEDTDRGTVEHWTPQEVAGAFRNNDIVLIDVRTPQEYAFEHIAGALLAPMHSFQPENMPLNGDRQVVFHCGSGARSRKVADQCLGAETNRVAHMKGGFSAWKDAGLDYIGTDMSTGAPRKMKKTT